MSISHSYPSYGQESFKRNFDNSVQEGAIELKVKKKSSEIFNSIDFDSLKSEEIIGIIRNFLMSQTIYESNDLSKITEELDEQEKRTIIQVKIELQEI